MKKFKKVSLSSKLIWIAIIIGFAIMEFPGVFFINRVKPLIFGLPFIYGFILIIWIYMCIVLLIAYKINWGKKTTKDNESTYQRGEDENQ